MIRTLSWLRGAGAVTQTPLDGRKSEDERGPIVSVVEPQVAVEIDAQEPGGRQSDPVTVRRRTMSAPLEDALLEVAVDARPGVADDDLDRAARLAHEQPHRGVGGVPLRVGQQDRDDLGEV